MKEKIYILTHTDLDGFFSAAVVEFLYKLMFNPNSEFKVKTWTYGRDLPNTKAIKTYDKVFITDLCPDDDFMYDLYEYFHDNFIWIDHHVSPDNVFTLKFIEKYQEYPKGLRAQVEHKDSAAALAWKYMLSLARRQDEFQESKISWSDTSYDFMHTFPAELFTVDTECKVPYWLKLISDFDCWNRKSDKLWNEEVMPFFTALKMKVTSSEEALLYIQNLSLIEKFDIRYIHGLATSMPCEYMPDRPIINKDIEEGKLMYSCMRSIWDADAKHGFERTLHGVYHSYKDRELVPVTLKAWICNTQERSSCIFETMPTRDNYDVFIPYHYNGKKYFYSMYTFNPGIRCNKLTIIPEEGSSIELVFNGHKDAAGSTSEKFAFE